MNRATKILFILALLLPTIAVSLYVYKFAIPNNFALASELETWSHFGGYVGGVLSPIFAFLAFGGVLLTVHLQQLQIKHLESQSHIDELQSLISGISSNIDGSLNSMPKIIPSHLKNKEQSLNIWQLISAAGTSALKKTDDYMVEVSNTKVIDSVKSSIRLEVSIITIEIHQLVWCLDQYIKAGGSDVVESYYKKRYEVVICWLDAINLIDNQERIQRYFEPKELRKYLNQDDVKTYKQDI